MRRKKERQVKLAILLALGVLILPNKGYALEIQGDSTQHNNNEDASYQEDNPIFSEGGMLLTGEGEFFEPIVEQPVEIGSAVDGAGTTGESETQTFNVSAVVPEAFGTPSNANTYSFVGSGILQNLDGDKSTTLWQSILKLKEIDVALEFEQLYKEGFKSLIIDGDLDTKMGDSIWIESAGTLFARYNENMTVRLSIGAENYYILLQGNSSNKMQWTFEAIDQYKDAVRMGVIAGSIRASYNVYGISASSPVMLSSLVEVKSDGKTTVKSHTNINYKTQYFLNPLFGKMKYDKVMKEGTQVADFNLWTNYTPSIKLSHAKGNKIMFALNSQYHSFISKTSEESKFLTSIADMSNLKGDGLKSYTAKYSTTKSTPLDLADSSLYLSTPVSLSKVVDGDKHKLTLADYKVNLGLKYSAYTNHIYTKKGSDWVRTHQLEDLSMSLANTMVYGATVDGVAVGTVVPLEYKEMIVNPANDQRYFTGRTVVFGGEFYNGMKLDEENSLLFSTRTVLSTDADKIMHFTFPKDGSLSDAASHMDMKAKPEKVTMHTAIELPSGDNVSGAVMYRNNTYAENEKLMAWLQTDNAKAAVGVKAEELYDLIKGIVELDSADMTFEEYQRLQEIKDEMAQKSEMTWQKTLSAVITWLGYGLIAYGTILAVLFMLDQVNPLTNRSLLKYATLGRLQGVMYKDDLEYIIASGDDEETKFMVWYQILLLCVVVVGLGVVLGFTSTLLTIILWLYEKGGGLLEWAMGVFY